MLAWVTAVKQLFASGLMNIICWIINNIHFAFGEQLLYVQDVLSSIAQPHCSGGMTGKWGYENLELPIPCYSASCKFNFVPLFYRKTLWVSDKPMFICLWNAPSSDPNVLLISFTHYASWSLILLILSPILYLFLDCRKCPLGFQKSKTPGTGQLEVKMEITHSIPTPPLMLGNW